MKCTDVKPNLWLYRDGETNAALQHDIEQHLKDCANCRAIWQSVREYDQRITSIRHEVIEAMSDHAVSEFAIPTCHKTAPTPTASLRLTRRILRIAAVVAISVSAYILWHEQQQFNHAQLAIEAKQLKVMPINQQTHFHNTCIEESKDALQVALASEKVTQSIDYASLANLRQADLNKLSDKLCQQVGMFLSTTDIKKQQHIVSQFLKDEWRIDLEESTPATQKDLKF